MVEATGAPGEPGAPAVSLGPREAGGRAGEATVLGHLGDRYQAAGDRAAADAAWRRALDILGRPGHPDASKIRDKLGAQGAP